MPRLWKCQHSQIVIVMRCVSGGTTGALVALWVTVRLSEFEHRLDRTARTYLSFIGAPESHRLP